MSELTRELIEPTVTKKHVIEVIILVGILITAFAFSVFFVSLIFGTQRKEPSSNLEDAEYENAEQLEPHFPIDLNDLWDYLNIEDLEDLEDLGIDISDLDPQDLEDLANLVDEQDIANFVQEMNDGDIDNYDLAMAGLVIAALLFSNVEVFRVYDYDTPIEQREDILWKYECFDQFNGEDWQCTVPMEYSNWPTYDDRPPTSDLIKIKRALSTISGSNSMVLGSLFPVPNIVEQSISAPSLDNAILFKNEFGSVTGDLYFGTATDLNMTYELFDSYLSTPDEINSTAVDEIYTPLSIKNRYLQLPGGINNYINTHNYFHNHYNTLSTIINSGDNAFMVANKIRNYLQTNFVYSFNELVNDPPEGDVVEWFCDKQEGMSSEFASAFCAFTRAFGVSSRFVDGYNSRLIEEIQEGGKLTYPIKYKNIYNWAEIYVPRDTLGNGQWVQMDVLYDTFGEGGQPITTERFNISVLANSSKYFTYNRNQYAKLTAKINSTESNVVGRTITFRDLTLGQPLGSNITNSNGFTSIIINTNSQSVGPHLIEGSIGADEDTAFVLINGDINVVFQDISPNVVNVSKSDHRAWAVGYVEDSLNHQRINNANLTFLLFNKGTNNLVPNAFAEDTTYTSNSGVFNTWLDTQEHVPYGEYEIRVDFNGSWVGFPRFSHIHDSSDRLDFNVTKEITYRLLFNVNGRPTEFPADPNVPSLINVYRNKNLNLSVVVFDEETGSPLLNGQVEFYDHTNGNKLIGTDITDNNGFASIPYIIGSNNKAGPSLVYAKIGNVENFSYFIVNEPINITYISGPEPRQVNIAPGLSSPFNIKCRLIDSFNNWINDTRISLRMFRSGVDYTDYLSPSNPESPNPSGSNYFNIYKRVISSTPARNYTLRLDFNGTFNFLNAPYRFNFYLNNYANFSKSYILLKELRVFDPNDIKIYLKVEGRPTREFYDLSDPPQKYKRGVVVQFQVNVTQSGSPPPKDSSVSIWDVYSNRLLSTYTYPTSDNGYCQFGIPTNQFYNAGIRKIQVQFMNYPSINTTFIVINESVNLYINPVIQTTKINNVVFRNEGGFTVKGAVKENGTGLKGLMVRVLLFDKSYNNLSHYLIGNPYGLTDNSGNYSIYINSISIDCSKGEYYIRVDFNGTINIPETPGINPIPNYLDYKNSSSYIPFNVTAGTEINQFDLYSELGVIFPDIWIIGDILHVIGNLTFDNNTIIANMKVNVTVQLLDGTIIAYNDTVKTNEFGEFHGLIKIGANWPTKRTDTKIVVYFEPKVNDLKHTEKCNKFFT